ncbi:MAG: phospho-sugar mutase [Clostridia bacterium]|nr:phospho-sugar mutase [Clostridia bacterium]
MILSLEKREFFRWLDSDLTDPGTKQELAGLLTGDSPSSVSNRGESFPPVDEEAVFDRFHCGLSFGTAGLRGKMRAGLNGMNVYTVGQATQGMANLIVSSGPSAMKAGVVIAHDCRNHSREFAERSAEILAANGIRVYLFESLRPTPELSFAIGYLRCTAGINITASHNPKQDNGFKAYWSDGAQIDNTLARAVSEEMRKTDILTGVKRIPLAEAIATGLVSIIGEEIDQRYLETILAELVDPEIVKQAAGSLRIVYTPLHGTGYRLVPEVLSRIGVTHLYPVPEQMIPDGDFPTVERPNPQYPEVFRLGIDIAQKEQADLIIATDPDADRVGVMAKGKDGIFSCLTGNQMGVLLLDYIIQSLRRLGKLPRNPYAVRSIVSTPMADRVCEANGVRMLTSYTGFRFIALRINEMQNSGNPDGFLLAFEESYGYLRGSYAKDKDGVVTSMLITEMAAFYRLRGMTLIDAMEEMYRKYGACLDRTDEVLVSDAEKKNRILSGLRENPPATLGGEAVCEISDYLSGICRNVSTGAVSRLPFEPSDVLSFRCESGTSVMIRPSGTEPKIKIYISVSSASLAGAEERMASCRRDTARWS